MLLLSLTWLLLLPFAVVVSDQNRLTNARAGSAVDRVDSGSGRGLLLTSVGSGRDKDKDKNESARERTHLLSGLGVELDDRGKGFERR